MLQQIIALIFIVFFVLRIIYQRQKKQISIQEFIFWLIFWVIAGLAIGFIKQIDNFVAKLGFSGKGIDVLLYLAVAILFYFVFRLRIKLEKIERNITKIIREIATNEDKILKK